MKIKLRIYMMVVLLVALAQQMMAQQKNIRSRHRR